MKEPGENVLKSVPPFKLLPLPYNQDALQPMISSNTLSFHYLKHHQKYVTTTNEIIQGTPFEKASLENIIMPQFNTRKNRNIRVETCGRTSYCLYPEIPIDSEK